jgi:hypothetical protein
MGIGLTEWTIYWCEAIERQLAADSGEEWAPMLTRFAGF